jgi:hypothetical protein
MDGNVLVRPHFEGDTHLLIEHVQDCTPILEWNHEARRDEQRSDWGRHVARVPNVILVKWLDEAHANGNTSLRLFSAEFNALVVEKIEDGEWAYLRTDRRPLQVGW